MKFENCFLYIFLANQKVQGFKVQGVNECYDDLDPMGYAGTHSITSSGKLCLRWDSINMKRNPNLVTDGGHHNHCRNYDNRDHPFCLVKTQRKVGSGNDSLETI